MLPGPTLSHASACLDRASTLFAEHPLTANCGLMQIHISSPAMGLSAEALIKNASQTEKTLVNKDFSHLNNLSSSVTLHQDGFTLNKDIEGEEAVKKYLAAYFEKYDYTHETLMYAVNEKTKASFALAYDKVTHSPCNMHSICSGILERKLEHIGNWKLFLDHVMLISYGFLLEVSLLVAVLCMLHSMDCSIRACAPAACWQDMQLV